MRPLAFVVLFLCGVQLGAEPTADPGAQELAGYDLEEGEGRVVYEVPIEGTIDLGLAAFVERVTDLAAEDDIIVLRIKTFGGRVDAAVRIRDALLGAKATTVGYVDSRAISAGALITLACETILMSSGASIGATTPVAGGAPGQEPKPTSEKVISYMRAEMRTTAEARGRRGDLAEAMVDPDVEIKDVTAKGKLLTLTSAQALEVELADAVVDSYEEVYELLNLKKAQRVEAEADWGERVARFLTDPMVSSMLMTFGFLGLLMEFYTPGFGVGGFIGIACLALFFGGQYAAHLAGWEELVVFAVGFALLMVEVFAIPGFGVAGAAGLVLMAIGLMMALTELDLPWDVSFELGYVQEAISAAALRIVVAAVALMVAAVALGKFFPRSAWGGWLVLRSTTDAKEGYVSEAPTLHDLVGQRGVAASALRPAGIADIGGRRVDVVTAGDYIEAKAEVEVAQVDGNRVVVVRV